MALSAATGTRARVVVVGAGFGGIYAAEHLGKVPVDVTVVDRKNHHTFQPLLYQVALAVLSPGDIAQPIRSILRDNRNTEVLMDEVVGFDVPQNRVLLKSGAEILYDYLILGTGSTHSYFGKDEWAKLAPGLKTVEDATEIRRRVLLAFELAERQMVETGSHPPLNFVIIGGGPTGVELAGAISDIARLYMTKDFRHIDPSSANVLILEGSPHILGAYPEDLQQKAVEQLAKLGVRVRTGSHVTDVQPGYVMVGEERIESVCTLWAAGVQASPLGKMIASAIGAETDRRGCVVVDQHLNPAGHPEIFVIGDLAHFEQDGAQVPGVAQPAMQMGAYAAGRIGLLVSDPAAAARQKAFRYFDKGDMATIGRKAAVARIVWPFHAHWSGFMAWLTWLTVHIFFLIGFRNRWSVFRQWAYTYIRFQDGVRLIVGSQELPGGRTWRLRPVRSPMRVRPRHEERRPSYRGAGTVHPKDSGRGSARRSLAMGNAVVVKGRKVRYAVVGIGWISQTAFLPGVEHTGNSEVVAFVSGHEDKAAKVGEKYGVKDLYSYDEYDKLLSSGTIDAVYLATPNWDHVDLAVRTLNAGIHLLLEKPMATSVEDCERIIAASEGSGAKLMVAYRLHHEPGTLKAFEVARSGKLGHLRYFNSSFSQPVNYQNHRAKNGYWAGPVPDMGPYPINTARNLFNAEPLEVFAMGTRTDPERFRDFDDQVAVNLRFPGERIATMLLSYSGADLEDFRIVGTLGDLYSSPAFGMGVAMKHEVTIGESTSSESFKQTDQFGGELKYFSDCIVRDKHPEADGEEGLLDIRVIAAAERSLASGKPEALAPYVRRRRPAEEQVETLHKSKEPQLVSVHQPSEGR